MSRKGPQRERSNGILRSRLRKYGTLWYEVWIAAAKGSQMQESCRTGILPGSPVLPVLRTDSSSSARLTGSSQVSPTGVDEHVSPEGSLSVVPSRPIPPRAGQRLASWLLVRPMFPLFDDVAVRRLDHLRRGQEKACERETCSTEARSSASASSVRRWLPLRPTVDVRSHPDVRRGPMRFSGLGEPKGEGSAARRGRCPERIERSVAGTTGVMLRDQDTVCSSS